ncbi:Sec-independent protein translocase subunit TatA/TatB [Aestuariivirga litoralis]|uniref:Sec-independent protein translocase subunit TatA/TatB n=1 Tax=Aestuariivirga litoralis TaxID=2650924 RepID=UPI0018C6D1ED|nr:hypothetical protein [Aestuariivirga litoralis]MBG1231367.1 hypothetical protein [Aestuariivirga litoralis]
MFDFGLSTSHILVIVVLAIIAIGPKDLPTVLRRFGQFMNKMRGMARDFQGQVDVAMKDAGMDGVQQDLKSLRTGISAAVAPMQTLASSAASSAMSSPSASASSTAIAAAASSTPAFHSGNDFSRYFGDGTGETRVQGRGLDDGVRE